MTLEIKFENVDNGWLLYTEMVVLHNGEEIIRESDGGEPEDNSFYRDWSWVPQAIQQAYDLGYKDGEEHGYKMGEDTGYSEGSTGGYLEGYEDARRDFDI